MNHPPKKNMRKSNGFIFPKVRGENNLLYLQVLGWFSNRLVNILTPEKWPKPKKERPDCLLFQGIIFF